MSEELYPRIYDTDESDSEDSCTSETTDSTDIQVTAIEITRDMEKWMETLQSQYETYRDKAIREILDILLLETT